MVAVIHRTKRVEFLGLPSPFQDPAVQAMKARGDLTPRRRKALWKMEQQRQMQGFCRFRGVTILKKGPETGLSRPYTFGPTQFVVEMDVEDIDRLMAQHPSNPQAFRVLDDFLVVRG
jgi:hypothetical protein